MIGKGVRERSQRRQRENILFLTPSLLVLSFDLGSAFIWLYPLPAPPTEPKLLVVYLWNSAKIVVLGPYLCIRIWGTDHDWPVQKAIVSLPIRLEGNSKHISSNLLSSLGSQNKDLIGVASQTLLIDSLIGVSWHLHKQCSYWLNYSYFTKHKWKTQHKTNKQTTCYAG